MLSFDERLKNLTETIGDPEENKYILELINSHPWQLAKTYVDFCPHEYTLKFKWKNWNEFYELMWHIWKYGVDGYFGRMPNPSRYWFDHEGGYYYFLLYGDITEEGVLNEGTILINRAKIEDFPFWVEEDITGKRVRCKYGFGKKKTNSQEAEGNI